MKVLALETSAKACSAAVTEDGRVVASAFHCTGLTHSRTLMPMLEDMLRNADLTLSDCDIIAVANGPGSFTGIRIGIAAAKGLAFAADKPAAGVSTLESMALGCAGMNGLIVCAMDARRQQIYNAVFRAENGVLTRLREDRAISLEEAAADCGSLDGPLYIVGDGASLCHSYFTNRGIACTLSPPHLLQQSAVGVAMAAAERWPANAVSAQALEPTYLRLSQAERERLAKLQQAES